MFWSNIKIAIRNLRKNKGFAIINIAGLAIGLTVYIFGGLLVRYEDTLGGLQWPAYLAVMMALLGVAMISNLRFPKLALADNFWLNVPHVANILALYIFGSLRIFPEYQFGCAMLVVVVGVTLGVVRRPVPA